MIAVYENDNLPHKRRKVLQFTIELNDGKHYFTKDALLELQHKIDICLLFTHNKIEDNKVISYFDN